MKENRGGGEEEREGRRERAEGKHAGIPLNLRSPAGYESSEFDGLWTPYSLRFPLTICGQLSTLLTWWSWWWTLLLESASGTPHPGPQKPCWAFCRKLWWRHSEKWWSTWPRTPSSRAWLSGGVKMHTLLRDAWKWIRTLEVSGRESFPTWEIISNLRTFKYESSVLFVSCP